MNSFTRVRAFQIELEFGSVGVCGEGRSYLLKIDPISLRVMKSIAIK